MWIISTQGFISIVQHSANAENFLLRARTAADLVAHLKSAGVDRAVQETPDADYRFRVIVTRAELNQLFAALPASIDYPNFKNAVAARGGDSGRLAAYHAIWHVLQRLQR